MPENLRRKLRFSPWCDLCRPGFVGNPCSLSELALQSRAAPPSTFAENMQHSSSVTRAPSESPPAQGLYRYSLWVAVSTLVLIKLGAMVTSTGSGMAYLDWPLSNGSLLPPDMIEDPAKFFEHFHRMAGALVGLLVVALTVWVFRSEDRRWLKQLTLGVLILVCAQGIIGGVGVLKGLPVMTSVTHGVLAQVIFCLLALVAFALSPTWRERMTAPAQMVRRARLMAAVALALVFLQLVAGAILRHANLPGLLWVHVSMALLVALAILAAAQYCGTRLSEVPGFTDTGRLILMILVVQLILGYLTFVIRRLKDPSNIEYLGRSFVVTAHVAVGALMFLSSALLLYRVLRNVEPGGESV